MSAEKFWLKWLKVTVSMIILVGLLMAIVAPFINLEILDKEMSKVFFLGGIPGDPADLMKRWMIAVAGAVMLGWGFTMMHIVNHAFPRKEKWAWRSVFYPIIAWYILDSFISSYFGASFNVIINTILFLQIMAPLLYLRKEFFPRINTAS